MEVTIRRAEPWDYAVFTQLFNTEAVYANTLHLPYASQDVERKTLDVRNNTLLACADEEVIGAVCVFPSQHPRMAYVGSISLVVRPDRHGQGVGGKLMQEAVGMADNWLNMLRLELVVYTDNAPAVHLYKKFGFEIEGTHRAHSLRAGCYADAHTMARLHPSPPVLG